MKEKISESGNRKSVEGILLKSSGEIAFEGPCSSWNEQVVVKLLDEASEMGLSDDAKVVITYDGFVGESYLTGQRKTKTIRELKDNYFRWENKEYFPKKII
jgi:hypothetical protein